MGPSKKYGKNMRCVECTRRNDNTTANLYDLVKGASVQFIIDEEDRSLLRRMGRWQIPDQRQEL